MRAAGWMIVCGLAAWLGAAALVDRAAVPALFLGMIAPLGAAAMTWWAVESTYVRNPARVTRVLLVGFAAKMVFFGAYVTLVMTELHVHPVPFVVSFTSSFVGLYAAEALMLHRLTRPREAV